MDTPIHIQPPTPATPMCVRCTDEIPLNRAQLGYRTCLACGEHIARQTKHTIVPMPKSNYIVVTDRDLLLGLNSSHRGNR